MNQESGLKVTNIEEILENLRDGTINISICDGKIMHIDMTNNTNQFPLPRKAQKQI